MAETFFSPCPRGLEALLAEELTSFGARAARKAEAFLARASSALALPSALNAFASAPSAANAEAFDESASSALGWRANAAKADAFLAIASSAFVPKLNYFLPEIQYNPSIPTPEQYLGYQIGDWHVTHDQLTGYFKVLDAASDRIEIGEYARSHENRPLFIAMISSPNNLKNKENIKKQHADLAHAETSSDVNIKTLPAILWQGYSIHGNEPSGNNGAMMVAYYLAAGQSKELEAILEHTFILMDPCLNPDGAQRFSTWVNSHKSKTLVSDPSSRESF